MAYQYRYDRSVLRQLLADGSLTYDEVCEQYEKITGKPIKVSSLKDLIQRKTLYQDSSRHMNLDQSVMDEIILDDPWVIAYPADVRRKYITLTGAHPSAHKVAAWLRENGIATARRSPDWEEEVLEVVRSRKLTGYMDPATLAD